MRLISFNHTSEQIRDRTKTVTRRTGWKNLTTGTLLLACEKTRNVERENREELAVIRVLNVRQEPLRRMLDDKRYGRAEIRREGFEGHSKYGTPEKWVEWFCRTHDCTPDSEITRIEFAYHDSGPGHAQCCALKVIETNRARAGRFGSFRRHSGHSGEEIIKGPAVRTATG
jgi:hypothetical protein